MTCSIIHHGHIRLLEKASSFGFVIVGLTSDDEVLTHKGYLPELIFEQRQEILKSIRYVDEVIASPWLITDEYIKKHNIDLLVHGDDDTNPVTICEKVIYKRTPEISSSKLREQASYIFGETK